jgi:hypothetical protein
MAREGLDDDLTERLLSRKAGGVHERRAYGIRYQTGPMVDRVLGHLRVAHAFEMGGEIFMPSGANLRDPKTVGLLFHERYHQWVSERTSRGSRQLFMSSDQDQGAEVSGEERKAEDYAAMVLDTATNISDGTAGESELNELARDPGNPLSDTSTDSADDNVSSAKVAAALIGGTKDRDPMRGYFAMREQGFTHQAIVRDLARDIVDKLSRMNEMQSFRTASSDTFGV